jgi:hypothetical protein
VNDERYTRETYNLGYAIGNHAENRYWADRGAKDGDPVTLIVEHDGEEITVSGRLMANRFYFDDNGRQTLGLGDPDRLLPEVDDNGNRVFESSWGEWYQDKTEPKPGSWQFILDGSWERTGFNNRSELEAHLEDKERIEYLVAKYSSEFAETMRRDWDRVRDYLDGEAVELSKDALDYRTRADELRKGIGGYAERAIAALEAELADRLETSPSASDLDEQREVYVGKVVYFDGLGNRNIINDLEQTLMVAGGDRDGYFFLDAAAPAMDRAFDALYRYRALETRSWPSASQCGSRYWMSPASSPSAVARRSDCWAGWSRSRAEAGKSSSTRVRIASNSHSPARRRPRSSVPARLPPGIRRRRPSRAWSRLSRRVTGTPGRACSPNGASSRRMRRDRRFMTPTTACCRRTSRMRGRPRAV